MDVDYPMRNDADQHNNNTSGGGSASDRQPKHAECEDDSSVPEHHTSGMTTLWGASYHQWRDVRLKEQLTSQWDDAFKTVVGFKEMTAQDKHTLITTVKEFAAAYKADPSSDKVEGLLKFFKKFIAALYERADISERHFIGIYQAISLVPDPAPLLHAAHVEVSTLVGRIRSLQTELTATSQEYAALQRMQEATIQDVWAGGSDTEGSRASATDLSAPMMSIAREVRDLRQQVDMLRSEKRSMVDMVRQSETHSTTLREEVARLIEDRRALTSQLMQAQSRYDEYVARAERDVEVLLQELADANHTQLVSASSQLHQSVAEVSSAIVQSLESEVQSLRRALQEAEDSRDRASAHRHHTEALEASKAQDSSGVEQAALHHTQTLHEEIAMWSRKYNESLSIVSNERRLRREAEILAAATEQTCRQQRQQLEEQCRLVRQLQQCPADRQVAIVLDQGMPIVDKRTTDEVVASLLSDGAPPQPQQVNSPLESIEAIAADPQLVRTLLLQREHLRIKLLEEEARSSQLRDDFAKVQRDALLLASQAAAPVSPLSDPPAFGTARLQAALLASAPAQPLQTEIAVGSAGDTQGTRRRRRAIQLTVRKAADGFATIVANMLVHSATTRMLLMFYVLFLHCAVMASTYGMAFRSGCGKTPGASAYVKGAL